jgi:arylsulfatase A-like enzyme
MRAGAPNSPGDAGFDTWVSSPNFYENSPLFSRNGEVIQTEGESSMVTVEAALPFMKQAAADGKPFLAVIWFGNPHTPHQAVPELRALYPDQPPAKQNYLGEITGIDRAVGRLRKELRAMGAADNTVLWYTSDNGAQGPGSTGGLRGRKGSVWEGGLRVPCVIEWPAKIAAPRRSGLSASTVDIYPTLLELAGVGRADPDRPLDGESLRRLIADADMPGRTRPLGFWDHPTGGKPMRSTQLLQQLRESQQRGDDAPQPADDAPAAGQPHPLDRFPGHAAWLDGAWKLHRMAGNNGGNVRFELYNLSDDPTESRDLAEREAARVQRMTEGLEDWQRSVVKSLNGNDYK